MIIAAFNLKGGVGKTTTAINVGACLARTGRSVLVVDLEPDMNASISLGVRPSDTGPSIVEVLLYKRPPVEAVRPIAGVRNLHLITGSPALAQMDVALRNVRNPERRLADAIRPLVPAFDVIVLDCPAGFSLLSLGVPLAANELIVPIRAEYLCLESLAHFLRWYGERGARKARVAGILLTRVDHRWEATREIVEIIRLHNRRSVFRTEIPEDPRAIEAPSHGIPLVKYARSKSALAYQSLTTELLTRIRRGAS